jgi:Amt family ammonium transporter
MYGADIYGGLIGWHYSQTQTRIEWHFFQTGLAVIPGAIVVGAIAPRATLIANVLSAFIVSSLVYPIYGHWLWSQDGWLRAAGTHDFGGASVIHLVGGIAAAAGALVVGSHSAQSDENQEIVAERRHSQSLPLVSTGILILWIGWIGLNGGAIDMNLSSVGVVVVTTLCAGGGGALAVLVASGAYSLAMRETWRFDPFEVLASSLGGMVAVTAICDLLVDNPIYASVAIGGLGGLVATTISRFLILPRVFSIVKIYDPMNVIAVHAGGGATGMLIAPFLSLEISMLGQILAVTAAFLWTFPIMWIFFYMLSGSNVVRLVSAHTNQDFREEWMNDHEMGSARTTEREMQDQLRQVSWYRRVFFLFGQFVATIIKRPLRSLVGISQLSKKVNDLSNVVTRLQNRVSRVEIDFANASTKMSESTRMLEEFSQRISHIESIVISERSSHSKEWNDLASRLKRALELSHSRSAMLPRLRSPGAAQDVLLSRKLAFSPETVRDVIAGLERGHVLLVGPPACGKTSLMKNVCAFFEEDENKIVTNYVTTTPGLTSYDMIGGKRFIGRELGLHLGLFTSTIMACVESGFPTVLIVDELNRSIADDMFAGLMDCLLPGHTELVFPDFGIMTNGMDILRIPSNFRLICAFNEEDFEYGFPISDQLMRRFAVVHVAPIDFNLERAAVLADLSPISPPSEKLMQVIGELRNLQMKKKSPTVYFGTGRISDALVLTQKNTENDDVDSIADEAFRKSILPALNHLEPSLKLQIARDILEVNGFEKSSSELTRNASS